MTIRKLEYQDIDSIAILHEKYLSDGLLANLGLSFLKGFYKLMLEEKSSVSYVAVEKKTIIGFIASCVDLNKVKRASIINLWNPVLVQIFKNPRLILTIISLSLHPGLKVDREVPKVISLAVTSENRGKGIGKSLLGKSKLEFKKRGFRYFVLSVKASMKDANAFYQKIGLKSVKVANFLGEEMVFYKGRC